MQWSLNKYNLIVRGNTDDVIFTSQSGSASFDKTRMFEHTKPEYKETYQIDLKALSDLPALVLSEIGNGRNAPAFLSRISDVEVRGAQVAFRFEHMLEGFSSQDIFDCGYFDISIHTRGIDERTRTHWAVKHGNVFEGIGKLVKDRIDGNRPVLFNVSRWPLPKLGHVAVMMPFDSAFNPVYEAIQSTCSRLGLIPLRVDQIYRPTPIVNDIFSTIAQCRLGRVHTNAVHRE